jgi:uncharacterized membrane protein
MFSWAHAGTAFTASFLASLVEFVEALTIVLAVGSVRGWKSALIGVAAAVVFLAALVAILGGTLQRVPITTIQIVVGLMALVFGMRWLRKAILRSAGVIKMHDEAAIYAKQAASLAAAGAPIAAAIDKIAAGTAFQAVVVEGLEVVFIVLATGAAGHTIWAAVAGATLAGVLVILLGVAVHTPLTKVPENTLKFAVGILLSSYGAFWMGEGLNFAWPGSDLSLFGLIGGFLIASLAAVKVARNLVSIPKERTA